MEAFLDLLSSGALQVELLARHRFAVEEGGKAYAAVEAGAYTGIIDYHAPHAPDDRQRTVGLLCLQLPRNPQAKDKLRVGCIGAGGFARGSSFPISALLTG